MDSYYTFLPCMCSNYRQSVTPFQSMPPYPLPAIGTTYPTGIPAGPAISGQTPLVPGTMFSGQEEQTQIAPPGEMPPLTTMNQLYIPGFLKTQIGKRIRVEFLIGTGTTTDRVGTLLGVGASYILLRLEETDDVLMADLYSIKFVTIYH
jgi:hypothetical protein